MTSLHIVILLVLIVEARSLPRPMAIPDQSPWHVLWDHARAASAGLIPGREQNAAALPPQPRVTSVRRIRRRRSTQNDAARRTGRRASSRRLGAGIRPSR